MTVLITGGTGFVGSHCYIELIQAGHEVLVLDNFSNSKRETISRLKNITGNLPKVIEGDVRDTKLLEDIFRKNQIRSIIHAAGKKSVSESIANPVAYYSANIEGSRNLLESALKYNVENFLFSSSATVYGVPRYLPIDEKHPLSTTNPYGETKRVVEELLKSVDYVNNSLSVGILRYFNPIGAHKTGLIGETPNGIPNNLLPYIAQVAAGERPHVNVYGDDYNTPDGTGIRDYIHVVDLARAHSATLEHLMKHKRSVTLNLGTGRGYSVLEVIKAFELVSGKKIAIKITDRRLGDVAVCYTDATYAKKTINWSAEFDLNRMCEDHWRFQTYSSGI